METKSILWNLRISKSERKDIRKLAKRLKIKSEAEAVRRAVSHMLEITEPQRGQLPREIAVMQ